MREILLSFFEPPISSDPAQSTARLAWIVRLRWIALLAQLGTIPPALEFELLERRLLPYYLGVILALALVNVVTRATLLRRPGPIGQQVVIIQLGADIVALSALLALTGGAWNPMVPILFVHAGIGALLLEGQQSPAFFGLLIASLLLLQVFSLMISHIPPGLHGKLVPATILFPAQLLVALVFWILTAWLSRTLNALHHQFAMNRERKTRIDRLRAVGALAAGLSHEFATPLNTAQLKLARLGRRHDLQDDPDHRTAVDALHRCGDVLRHMAGAPLSPEGLDLEVVDVSELVRQVCDSLSQGPDGAPIRCRTEAGPGREALLPTLAFSQALINLIDNAAESGAEQDPIEVQVTRNRDRIDVSVLDRGVGWPDVVRAHLGQPFVTTKPDGVGLGLYFVHTLTEALGAEFRVDDRSDGGAIATISLPAMAGATAEAAR
jgi:two-component system sensor histidine kinase RegB